MSWEIDTNRVWEEGYQAGEGAVVFSIKQTLKLLDDGKITVEVFINTIRSFV